MPAAYDHGFGLCLRHTACAFAAIALRYAAFYNGFTNEVVVNLNQLKLSLRMPTQTA